MMSEDPIIALSGNAALLMSMVLIFDVAVLRWRTDYWKIRKILSGVIIGGMAIAVMRMPWQYNADVIIDARSIILSISGLFFGALPTLIAMLMAGIARFFIGGLGAWTGISTILATGVMGIIWRAVRKRKQVGLSWLELYFFGLAVTAVMVVLQLTIPQGLGIGVFKSIGMPVMVIFPLATSIIGALIVDRLNQFENSRQLRQTQEQLKLALESSSISFFSIDYERQEISFSSEWIKYLGYAPGEMEADFRTWKALVVPDDLVSIFQYIDACVQHKEVIFELEYRARHKDGELRWFLGRGKIDYHLNGSEPQLLGVNVDITPIKQVEQALRESEARYQALVDHLPLGMIQVMNRDFQVIFCAGEAMQSMGITPDAWVGKNIAELLPVEFAQQQAGYFQNVLSGKSVKFEGQIYGKTFLVQAAPLLNANGEVEQIISLSIDISEQRQAEEQARAAQVELERLLEESVHSRRALLSLLEDQKNAEEQIRRLNQELERRVKDRTAQLVAANNELEAFAYSVSHDLRAPLRAIDGFSEALWNEGKENLPPKALHYLSRIRQGSERMSLLIEDLLTLSRLTRREVKRQETGLSQLVGEIAMELQSENGYAHLRLEIAPDIVAQADPQLMRIALQNLLSNAFKFTKPNLEGCIQFRTEQQDGQPVYFVRDNGVGFDMAYAEKLFTPFQRMHTQEEFPGTGVGLATVQRIISRHGGEIWTESSLNQGTTFFFTLNSKG